jgi:hypothetical protein
MSLIDVPGMVAPASQSPGQPSAVMNLMLLVGGEGGSPLPEEQVDLIQAAIPKNRTELAVPFSLPRLCARYAQQSVPAQKRVLKELEKAATFKRNRDAYLLSQASTESRAHRLHG